MPQQLNCPELYCWNSNAAVEFDLFYLGKISIKTWGAKEININNKVTFFHKIKKHYKIVSVYRIDIIF